MTQAKPRSSAKEAAQQDAPKAEPRPVVWPDIHLHTQQFERMRSLEKARVLLSEEPGTTIVSRNGLPAPKLEDMIRLAHYITTGRDYADRAELDKETPA